MITVTLSSAIRDVMIEIQGEANTIQDIESAYYSFLETCHFVKCGEKPDHLQDLELVRVELTTQKNLIEVL